MKHKTKVVSRLLIGLLAVLVLSGTQAALTQENGRIISPQGAYNSLADALAQAQDGDTIEVYGGVYDGPLTIDKPVKLIGHDWPIIEGHNQGTVLKLTAPGITLQGFVIQNSGSSLDQENSGIAVEAPNAIISGNRLEETLFGIYLRQAHNSSIRDNEISSKDLDVPRRGDAIRVWYSNGVLIEGNVVRKGRDVVLWYSEDLTVRNNEVSDGRYGLHFMYCDDATIEYNLLINNSVGTFLMYSRRLILRHNTIAYNRGPSGYGVGLKDMDDAIIENNLFLDNRVGAYLDGSPREVDSIGRFAGNVFAYNDIGVGMLPSVRHNQFTLNSFVDNREQVAIAGGGGGRLQANDWNLGDQGNYWSDYVGYDGNADGRGDIPYKSERLFENLLDRNSSLRLFVYSPVEQAIDFAARAVPFVKPQPKLTDNAPLMTPVMPTNLPPLPTPAARPLGMASLTLLGLAAVVFGLGNIKRPQKSLSITNLEHWGDPMIHVENVTKRFGNMTAVHNLSFDVHAGEAIALWGANGAGKTTALRCILGVIPYEGAVTLGQNHSTWQGKEARRLLGFVPQEINFHDDMTVRETLHFYARLKKTAVDTDHTTGLLQRIGLNSYLQKAVRDLSGGMKQRLALAIALLADPPVLILDEPTANLDVRAREEFLTLLAELKTAGKTLVFSSHRLEEVAALADRALVIESGQLIADCPPSELAAQFGAKTTLKLHMDGALMETAVSTLTQHGFTASRNGSGVWVQVIPLEKARPISLLAQAGIPVDDFQME